MTRMVLQACWPWFLWMLAAFALLWVVVRLSGARWNLPHIRRLHVCQEGSTQTVSFVLTLPIFIMLVLFIVQVSQLMIGVTIVHYAAFATARAAMVWLPAEMPEKFEPANQLAVVPQHSDRTWILPAYSVTDRQTFATLPKTLPSWKLRKIWLAAVYACAPICPSRDLYSRSDNPVEEETSVVTEYYKQLSAPSQSNPRVPIRLRNKMTYSARHTTVQVSGFDKEFQAGHTMNVGPTYAVDPVTGTLLLQEIGWEDPLTITVQHRFALLPGPAHLLARKLVNPNGQPDNVSSRIIRVTGNSNGEQLYATILTASLTLTNEGLKSVIPYVEYEQ